jgi:RNA polymerase sigma factor (sigma-70 family)
MDALTTGKEGLALIDPSVPEDVAGADVKSSKADELVFELLRRVRAHDRRAFEALYRLYHSRLARFLSRQLRQPQLVEEVLNDTMLTVWRRPDSFSGSSRFSTWLFSIAYRKALRARGRFDEPMEDLLDDRPSEEPGSDEVYDRSRASAAIKEAMATLSSDHRTVIDLTYFHEFSCREVAEIMDCPVDTVKTRMFHARRRLKAALAGGRADWL